MKRNRDINCMRLAGIIYQHSNGIFFIRVGAEFGIGGLAAMGAGIFTNPIDVIKVRLQMQGELLRRGTYKVLYKNTFHAAYVIAKHEGITALQSGVRSALVFQFVLNGTKLGVFKSARSHGITVNEDGQTNIPKTIFITGAAGCFGSVLASPFYMVMKFWHFYFFFLRLF